MNPRVLDPYPPTPPWGSPFPGAKTTLPARPDDVAAGKEIMNSKLPRIQAVIVALGTLALATEASSAGRIRVGTLSCNLAPTVGFIVGSRKRLSCRYIPDGP